MMSSKQQSIRTSQTMPQLYYTREDIQEQYLGPNKDRKLQQQQQHQDSSKSSKQKRFLSTSNKPTASSSKRSRSSDPKEASRLQGNPGGGDDDEDEDSSSGGGSGSSSGDENQEGGGSRGRRARRTAGSRKRRRRRRRAHSASLFSACFQIPNIGSMLPSSSAGNQLQSQRRSFLSHLGLGGGGSQHQSSMAKQMMGPRPISTSQTLGNLQVSTSDTNDQRQPSTSTFGAGGSRHTNSNNNNNSAQTAARKHVSFGGQQPVQQPPHQATAIPMSPAGPSGAPFSQQQSRNNNNNSKLEQPQRGSTNNVIMRNYQASQHHKKQLEPIGAPREVTEANNSDGQIASQSGIATNSPIYLVSSQANGDSDGACVPGGQPSRIMLSPQLPASSTPSSSSSFSKQTAQQNNAQVIYHNYPATNTAGQQQRSQTYINPQPHNIHSSSSGGGGSGSGSNAPPIPKGYSLGKNPSSHAVQVAPPPPPPTIYKRLPAVPMRTQATQTEITAYHLMTTPPLSSSSSAAGGRDVGARAAVAGSGSGGGSGSSSQAPTREQNIDSPGRSSGTIAPPSAEQTPVSRPPTMGTQVASGSSVGGGQIKRPALVISKKSSLSRTGQTFQEAEHRKQSGGSSSLKQDTMTARGSVAPEDGSDEWSVDEEDDDDNDAGKIGSIGQVVGVSSKVPAKARGSREEEDEGCSGSLKASTLLSRSSSFSSSSSSTSSSVSLVGHDSTLDLKLVPGDSPATAGGGAPKFSVKQQPAKLGQQQRQPEAVSMHASESRTASSELEACSSSNNNGLVTNSMQPRLGEENGPEAGASIMPDDDDKHDDDDRHPFQTTTTTMGPGLKNDDHAKRVRKQESTSGNHHPYEDETLQQGQQGSRGDIEPPCQFKDSSGRPCQSSSFEAIAAADNNIMDSFDIIQPTKEDLMDETPSQGLIDRVPSPPSLSEASSQTDASMAAHIMDLGKSLNNGRQFGQQQQQTAAIPSSSKGWPTSGNSSLSNDDFSSRVDVGGGGGIVKSNQQVVAASGSGPPGADGDGGGLLALVDEEEAPTDMDMDMDMVVERPNDEVGGPKQRMMNDNYASNYGDYGDGVVDDDAGGRAIGQTSSWSEGSKLAQVATPSGRLHDDDDDDDNNNNNNPSSNSTTTEIIMQDDDDADHQVKLTQHSREDDLVMGQDRPQQQQPAGSCLWATGASPAEQRRNDFLTLSSDDYQQLESTSADSSGSSSSSIGNGKHASGGDITIGAAAPPPPATRQRPSTSTLSTRHHSYCSTDDFSPIQGCENTVAGGGGPVSRQILLEDPSQEESSHQHHHGRRLLQPPRKASVTSATLDDGRSHDLVGETLDEFREREDIQASSMQTDISLNHPRTPTASSKRRSAASSSSSSDSHSGEDATACPGSSGCSAVERKPPSSCSIVSGGGPFGATTTTPVSLEGHPCNVAAAAAAAAASPLGSLNMVSKDGEGGDQTHSMATNGADKAKYCSQTIKRDWNEEDGGQVDDGSHKVPISHSPLEAAAAAAADGRGDIEGDFQQGQVGAATQRDSPIHCDGGIMKSKEDKEEEVERCQSEVEQAGGGVVDVVKGRAERESNRKLVEPRRLQLDKDGQLETLEAFEESDGNNNNNNNNNNSISSTQFMEQADNGLGPRDGKEGEPRMAPGGAGADVSLSGVGLENDRCSNTSAGRHLEEADRKLSASPPTTVSELDQDEELSTPSFVDNFRTRLDDACKLADSVVGQLMGECLAAAASGFEDGQQQQQQQSASGTGVAAAAITQPDGDRHHRRQSMGSPQACGDEIEANHSLAGASSLTSNTSSSSSSSSSSSGSSTSGRSSSTSVSGHSYACCHLRKEDHHQPEPAATTTIIRPQPPEKPAHLRQQLAQAQRATATMGGQSEPGLPAVGEAPAEAAAALAVATTSVAGAAASLQKIRYAASASPDQVVRDQGRQLDGLAAAAGSSELVEATIQPSPSLTEPAAQSSLELRQQQQQLGESKQVADFGTGDGKLVEEDEEDVKTLEAPVADGRRKEDEMAHGELGGRNQGTALSGDDDYEHENAIQSNRMAEVASSEDGSSSQESLPPSLPLPAAAAAATTSQAALAVSSSSSFDCPALVSRSGSVCSAVSVIQTSGGGRRWSRPDNDNDDGLESSNTIDIDATGAAETNDRPPSPETKALAVSQDEDEANNDLELLKALASELTTTTTDGQPEAALTEQSSPRSATSAGLLGRLSSSGSSGSGSSVASESRQATLGSAPSPCCISSASSEQQQHHHQQGQLAETEEACYQPPSLEGDEQFCVGAEMPTRRSSQELSTVSEVSEGELSLEPSSMLASQLSPLSRQQQHQQQQQEPFEGLSGSNQEAPNGSGKWQHRSQQSGGPGELGQEAAGSAAAMELTQMGELATDHDLAQSEYTLHSQGSEAAMLTAGGSLSETTHSKQSATSGASAHGTPPVAPTEISSPQPPIIYGGEQRRRSSTSGKVPSALIKAVGVDCPYVPDILPLSPTPPPLQAAVSGHAQAHPHGRLSHDDTMEAIEDDVEGEEQELREQQEHEQQQVSSPPPKPLDIEPPPAFGGSDSIDFPADRVCTPSESIKEEDDDDIEDDDDEESSISVSQHGVIVSQEIPSPRAEQAKRMRKSPQQSCDSLTPTKSARMQSPLEDEGSHDYNIPETHKTASQKMPPTHVQSQSLSTESATHAILEHLSRHNLVLDEPAPALEQHESSFETTCSATGTMKRKSKADGSLAGSASKTPSHPEELQSVTDLGSGVANKMHDQGGSSSFDDQQAKLQHYRRGPPLGQIKTTTNKGADNSSGPGPAAAVSGSLATDTSICSSCSCLEASFDSSLQEPQPQLVANSEPDPQLSSEPINPQQQQQNRPHHSQKQRPEAAAAEVPGTTRSQWMSQEEGTVFTENYWLAHWLYISEHEEAEIWRQAIDMSGSSPPCASGASASGGAATSCTSPDGGGVSTPQQTTTNIGGEGSSEQQVAPGMPRNMPEMSSTSSERSFGSKYKSTTRKMIHRRATIELYKRMMSNNLKREKRVEISRSNGEFGFRIHGSRPVVVSAIERGTSAETCGLQVGDLIYAINGTNILDMAHSDVVKLAHSADSSSLILDLVPTNDFLRMSKYNRSSNKRFEPTVTGYLMRLSPSTAQPLLVELQDQMSRVPGDSTQQRASKLNEVMRLAWRKRYFVLRSDNCLYWYRSPRDIEPYGGVNLQGFSASLTNEFSEPSYVIRLVKYGSQPHYLGTNNICDIQTWIDAINKAATEANQNDPYMKRTLTLARTKPSQIPEPDCSGYLYKFSHKRGGGAHWKAAYFVLKDACLYLFRDQQADNVNQASAVYYLHGYRVRNKQIEHKKHTFELIPPNRKTIRPMFLMASSEIDRKRWIAALEYSIERWIEIE